MIFYYVYTRSVQKVSSHIIWKLETFIEEGTRNTVHRTMMFGILIIAILTGVRWHLIVVLICSSLCLVMLSIFSCTCWLSVYFLWKKSLSRSFFSSIFNWITCFFILSCLSSYIFWILTHYQICDLQIFSPTQ